MIRYFILITFWVVQLFFNCYSQTLFNPPPSGRYAEPFEIKKDSNQMVSYITRGRIPNQKLTHPIFVDKTTQFIFKSSFKSGTKLVDTVFSRSYIFNSNTKFPIISIAIEEEDLWNDTTGIYVKGKYALFNDSTGHWDSCNYQKNWEREIFVTYIEPDNTIGFSQRAGIKIFGESTRRQPDKSLKIIARKEYGKGKFKHLIFGQKNVKKHKQLVIRTSGNDFNKTRFKDVLSTHLVENLGLDYMAYQPIQLYVNGEHWGLYNLREKINEHFIAENYNIPKDSVNIIMGKWVRQKGRAGYYMAMFRFFENVTEMNDNNYIIAKEFLDIRNYINYRVFQIFINNKDSRGNIRYWNANSYQKQFKMIVYDTDLGYENADYNYLKASISSTETNWHNPTWATLYLRKLLTNLQFKNEFINQFAHLMNTSLHQDSIIAQIDYLQAIYYGELPQDNANRPSHLRSVIFPLEQWKKVVEKLRYFAKNRGPALKKHIIEAFNLKGMFHLNIKGENGKIVIQKNYPQNLPFKGDYFKEIPIEIIALNMDGYKFQKWSDGDTNKIKIIDYKEDSLSLTAIYIADASIIGEKYESNNQKSMNTPTTSEKKTYSVFIAQLKQLLTLENLAFLLIFIGLLFLLIYIFLEIRRD
jgi:hypothetical protein